MPTQTCTTTARGNRSGRLPPLPELYWRQVSLYHHAWRYGGPPQGPIRGESSQTKANLINFAGDRLCNEATLQVDIQVARRQAFVLDPLENAAFFAKTKNTNLVMIPFQTLLRAAGSESK